MLEALALARKQIMDHFGLDYDHGCLIRDYTAHPWAEMCGGPCFWPVGYDLQDPEDEDYDEMDGEGELYGTSKWVSGTLTMFIVYNNGEKMAWVFSNDLKVEC